MSEQPQPQFITCHACNGAGENERGLACPNCGGMGLGAFEDGKFFYWGLKLNKAAIKLNRLKRKWDMAINLGVYIVGVGGLLALFWWLWQSGGECDWQIWRCVGDFSFWRVKSPLLLFFWLSVLADMFVVYRTSEIAAGNRRIPPERLIKGMSKRAVPAGQADIPDNWQSLKKSKLKIDVSKGFGREAVKTVEEAYLLVENLKQPSVKPAHLFFSSLPDRTVGAIFFRLEANGSLLIDRIKFDGAGKGGVVNISNTAKEVLISSYLEARALGQKRVEPMNLLLPAMEKDENLAEILYDMEIDKDKVANCLQWFRIDERMMENYRLYRKTARFKPSSSMDRAYTAMATPALNHFAYDLTRAAKWGRLELCIAREKEIASVFEQMEGGAAGVILTGPAGVGKKTVAAGIAELMVKEEVPEIFKDKRLVELDVARLISGARPEEAEERLLVILDETARAGNIVLYIDNIERIIGVQGGSEESLDLSDVLSGALERKSLYCLASATEENYAKYIEGTPLGNALTKIKISEPLGNQAIRIIEGRAGLFEGKYKVYFSYNAVSEAVKLTSKYMHDRHLPTKAIEILEDAAIRTAKSKGDHSLITAQDVAAAVSEVTGIPVTRVTENESEKLLNLERVIHERMIDQEEAVNMVAASLRRARAELREGKRPIANFLFLGPTGVGKTELAKTVAAVYFGDETAMIRLDMSEYQHPASVEKMIGGAGELGLLTEAARTKPFSLILLDEFEKAHPDILNLFLQVMDDGRLTDGQGRTVDFTNSIIIATSNAGAVYIEESIVAGMDIEQIKQTLINEHLNKAMRPELINRFDGIVVFKPLSLEDVIAITRLMFKKTAVMLEVKGIGLRLEEEGVKKLAEAGFDPKFGARPLRRVLQDRIENIIANKILAGELERRDTVIIDEMGEVGVEKGREL